MRRYFDDETERRISERDDWSCRLCGSVDEPQVSLIVSPKGIKKGEEWQGMCLCHGCRHLVSDFFEIRRFLYLDHCEELRRSKIKEGKDEQ